MTIADNGKGFHLDPDSSGFGLHSMLEADLSGAVVTEQQLATARLCKTKLPEGIDLDPDRDCEELDSSEVGQD